VLELVVVREWQTEDNLGFSATESPARFRLRSLESERAADLWIVGKLRVQREFPEVVRFRIDRRRIRGAVACAAGFGTPVSDLPLNNCSQ
jgi:hypothetical protein